MVFLLSCIISSSVISIEFELYSMEEKIEDVDWYQESDTSEEIPDPNQRNAKLFQDVDTLPVEIKKSHFQEGIIYFMTLDKTSLSHVGDDNGSERRGFRLPIVFYQKVQKKILS